MASLLKKDQSKIRIINRLWHVIDGRKGVRGGICQATYRYAKANNKYMRNFDKNNESSYVAHLDANKLYGWAMSHKLHVNGFKWVEKSRLSEFNEDSIKTYDEDSNTGYFKSNSFLSKSMVKTIYWHEY